MDLCDRIRCARELAGLSARQLDLVSGLAVGHTSLIEARHRPSPAAATAAKLAGALGVSLDWLVSGLGELDEDRVRAAGEAARARTAAAADAAAPTERSPEPTEAA